VARLKALACTPPGDSGLPLSKWSCPELARQAVTVGICEKMSSSTVRRVLTEDALKPWQYQSWIFITDPDFQPKAERVLDLYQRAWDGKTLGRNDYVISADEKTSIQARCRCHPTPPPGKARMMRVNHDYHRRGAIAYLAAHDVHQAKTLGRCEDTTGIVPFAALVEQVMTQEPYKSATRVFRVVDNGSSHRGQAAIDRLRPNNSPTRSWCTPRYTQTRHEGGTRSQGEGHQGQPYRPLQAAPRAPALSVEASAGTDRDLYAYLHSTAGFEELMLFARAWRRPAGRRGAGMCPTGRRTTSVGQVDPTAIPSPAVLYGGP